MSTRRLDFSEPFFRYGDGEDGFEELELIQIKPVKNGYILKKVFSSEDMEYVFSDENKEELLRELNETLGGEAFFINKMKLEKF